MPARLKLQPLNETMPLVSKPEQLLERLPGPAELRVTDEASLYTMLPLVSSTATIGWGLTGALIVPVPVLVGCRKTNLAGVDPPLTGGACGS